MNIIVWILGIVCAVWVIYDVFARNQRLAMGGKILWTVFALVFSIIAAVVYYFMYKK